MRQVLIEDIKRAQRRKALEPTELPLMAAAVDGKTIWCDSFEVDGPACQAMPHEAQGYFRMHALHAVLISVATQPCIDRLLVPKETNEMGALPQLIESLVAAYGASFIENALHFLRERSLRSEKNRRLTWKALGDDIMQALTKASAWRGVDSAEAATETF